MVQNSKIILFLFFFFKDKTTDNTFQNVLFLRDDISIIRVIDK